MQSGCNAMETKVERGVGFFLHLLMILYVLMYIRVEEREHDYCFKNKRSKDEDEDNDSDNDSDSDNDNDIKIHTAVRRPRRIPWVEHLYVLLARAASSLVT